MITITKKNSKEDGSCNGCSRYRSPEGIRAHDVHLIEVGASGFMALGVRLCDECLKEMREKVCSNEWQPIETAPKKIKRADGQHEYGYPVLAWPVWGQVARVRWWQYRDKDKEIEGSNFIDDDGRACHPTHWMPLPEPPE